jgi:hypothetical protein
MEQYAARIKKKKMQLILSSHNDIKRRGNPPWMKPVLSSTWTMGQEKRKPFKALSDIISLDNISIKNAEESTKEEHHFVPYL